MTHEVLERDPFGVTADPGAYIPRLATERALAALERGVEEGAGPLLLCGPAGLGKTLLLHVLAARVAPRLRAVVLSYSALSPTELCVWALEILGERPTEDPAAALLAHATRLRAHGSGLLLLLDDAGSMPPATARRMAELAAESRGALHLVGAAVDDARSGRVLAALGPDAQEIRLSTGMDPRETALYVRARLERIGAGEEERRRFDAETLERISRSSGGVPRVVQQLASEVLWRRGDARVRPAWALATEPLAEDDGVGEEELASGVEPAPSDARLASLLERREAEEEGEGAIWRALNDGVAARSARPAEAPRLPELAAAAPGPREAAGARAAASAEAEAPALKDAEALPTAPPKLAPASEPSPPVARPRAGAEPERSAAEPARVARPAEGTPGSVADTTAGSRPELEPVAAPPARAAVPSERAAQAAPAEQVARSAVPPAPRTARRPAARSDPTRRIFYLGLTLAVLLTGALLLLRLLPLRIPTPKSDSPQEAAPAAAPPRAAAPGSPTPEPVEAPPAPQSAAPERAEAPPAPAAEPPEPAAPAAMPAAEPPQAPPGAGPPPDVAGPSPPPAVVPAPAVSELAPAAQAPTPVPEPTVAPPAPATSPEVAAAPPVPAPALPTAAAAPTIAVDVNATPWASIEVDGQALGETPLAGIPLAPGTHRFRATFPGGRVAERDVRIDARRRRVVFR